MALENTLHVALERSVTFVCITWSSFLFTCEWISTTLKVFFCLRFEYFYMLRQTILVECKRLKVFLNNNRTKWNFFIKVSLKTPKQLKRTCSDVLLINLDRINQQIVWVFSYWHLDVLFLFQVDNNLLFFLIWGCPNYNILTHFQPIFHFYNSL